MFNVVKKDLGLVVGLLFAVSFGWSSEVLTHPEGAVPRAARLSPMPEEMGTSSVAKVLQRYFEQGLGGRETWDRIESLRLDGTMTLKDGDYTFRSYQKKPNFIKIHIGNERIQMQLGFDGAVAWRLLPGEKKAQPMEPEKARRFINSSSFGNRLLFPYEEGKVIEYIDTVPVDGQVCHHMRVTTENGYQVEYYLDLRSYVEVKTVSHDLTTGSVSEVVYEDYEFISGMPVAHTVRSYEDGELVSTLKIDASQVNTGIMPWMFNMPKDL